MRVIECWGGVGWASCPKGLFVYPQCLAGPDVVIWGMNEALLFVRHEEAASAALPAPAAAPKTRQRLINYLRHSAAVGFVFFPSPPRRFFLLSTPTDA